MKLTPLLNPKEDVAQGREDLGLSIMAPILLAKRVTKTGEVSSFLLMISIMFISIIIILQYVYHYKLSSIVPIYYSITKLKLFSFGLTRE